MQMASSSQGGSSSRKYLLRAAKTPCQWWAQGHCARGDSCHFLHGERPKPEGVPGDRLWKTKPCAFWKTGDCLKGNECPYAHGPSELRPEPVPAPGSRTRAALRPRDSRGHVHTAGPPAAAAQPEAPWSLSAAFADSPGLAAKSPPSPARLPINLRPPAPAKPLSMPVSLSEAAESKETAPNEEIFERPTICSDGFSYSWSEITQWLARDNTSPLTGEVLDKNILVPNHSLKQACDWLKEQLA